jgi:hypothetical protein
MITFLQRYQHDPKPDIFRIEELVIRVRQGDIKLPKFQRPFVWSRTDILKLWDSIYKGYPIGSFLLWLTHQKLARETRIGDLEIADRPDKYPTNYLLDGQQRLSTLCGALFWNGQNKSSMWNICFDLEEEIFFFQKNAPRTHDFPLNRLIQTGDFLHQCQSFADHPSKEKYLDRATSLLKAIKDYKIPAVTIGEMELSEVAPIFERINSTGRRLTIYDLMRAATWTGGFDLNDTVKQIRRSLARKGFESVSETQILRNVAASSGVGINQTDMESLRRRSSEELKKASAHCIHAYDLAVDFLTNELPVVSYAYLPYPIQLTFLAEFFRLIPQPSLYQREKLIRWFWRSSLTQYFHTTNDAQTLSDLDEIRKFAKGILKDLRMSGRFNEEKAFAETFGLNKAFSKGFALLLAQKNPRRLLDGGQINIHQALAALNRNEYHHIFPQAYLKNSGFKVRDIHHHANICLLNKGNNNSISDRRPSDYFGEVEMRLGSERNDVLQSNFISEKAFAAALKDDYSDFIRQRSESLTIGVYSLFEPVVKLSR